MHLATRQNPSLKPKLLVQEQPKLLRTTLKVKFAAINYAIAREIADAPQVPRWYRGDFFGDTFAGGQPKAAPAR